MTGRKVIYLILFILILLSCDTSKFSKTPISQFEGVWEFQERGKLDGIQIKIKKSGKKYTGEILELNDNKIVNMFLSEGDLWLKGIERNSNFQFKLIEKRVAADLFGMYGLGTSEEFLVEFNSMDTVLLGKNGIDGMYVRMGD